MNGFYLPNPILPHPECIFTKATNFFINIVYLFYTYSSYNLIHILLSFPKYLSLLFLSHGHHFPLYVIFMSFTLIRISKTSPTLPKSKLARSHSMWVFSNQKKRRGRTRVHPPSLPSLYIFSSPLLNFLKHPNKRKWITIPLSSPLLYFSLLFSIILSLHTSKQLEVFLLWR